MVVVFSLVNQFSNVELYFVTISDSHLLARAADPTRVALTRGGGAIRLLSGWLTVIKSNFERCTAAPWEGEWFWCPLFFANSTGLCSEGIGGAISTEIATVIGLERHKQRRQRRLCGYAHIWAIRSTDWFAGWLAGSLAHSLPRALTRALLSGLIFLSFFLLLLCFFLSSCRVDLR